jgi:hypothetical protein
MLRLPPKLVGWLCVLQTTVILMGYFVTRAMHKVYRQRSDYGSHQNRHPLKWFTSFMIDAGPWLLVLPLAWGVAATLTANLDGGIAEVSRKQTRIGYALSAALAVFALLSAMQMMSAAWDIGKITPIPGAD